MKFNVFYDIIYPKPFTDDNVLKSSQPSQVGNSNRNSDVWSNFEQEF